jgi:hypothetical protein
VFESSSPSRSMAAEINFRVPALEELSVAVELAVRTTLGISSKVASSDRQSYHASYDTTNSSEWAATEGGRSAGRRAPTGHRFVRLVALAARPTGAQPSRRHDALLRSAVAVWDHGGPDRTHGEARNELGCRQSY